MPSIKQVDGNGSVVGRVRRVRLSSDVPLSNDTLVLSIGEDEEIVEHAVFVSIPEDVDPASGDTVFWVRSNHPDGELYFNVSLGGGIFMALKDPVFGGLYIKDASDPTQPIRMMIVPGGAVQINDGEGNAALRVDQDGSVHVFSEEVEKFRVTGSGVSAFDATETKRLRVYDADVVIYDSAGNPALQVNADGSVHIKTGTSILADL